jgi:hypothetical protein
MSQVDRTPIPALSLDRAGKSVVGLLLFLSVGALAGGVALAAQPDGSVMHMPTSLLAGSPFTDFFYPGLILGGLFGVGSLLVAALGLLRRRIAPFLAFAIGVAMMIWIVMELAIIKELSFLHPLYFTIGLAIAVLAVRWGWPTFQGWRGR